MHRLTGGNDRGGHVRQEREAGGQGSHRLTGGIQQGIVRPAIQRQGSDHLAIDLPEKIEYPRHQQQRYPGVFAGINNRQGRDVETG